jgi:uncharacterized membrane protein
MSQEQKAPEAQGPDSGTKKSTTGLESNVAGLLSYLLGWVTGLIFFLLEEKDEFVRFHALQSIVVFGVVTAVEIVLGFLARIPYAGIVFTALQALVGLAAFALWIVLMVRAYQGQRFKLGWAGDLAERHCAKRVR